MNAQPAGGIVTVGSAGAGFCTFPRRDRASAIDRKIVAMSKILGIFLASSIAFNAYQWDLYRPWNGTAGFELVTKQRTPFEYSHHWRMHHRDFDYKVDNAPSLAEARARLVETITHTYGYRLPQWWELSRWYENVPPDFREEVEKAESRKLLARMDKPSTNGR
jgi:hypothetical protein